MTEAVDVVELTVRLEAPPDEVFVFLTDAERYVRWQGVKAELDPRPGGVYRVWMDADTVARGEYVEIDPPRRLVFTWGWEGNPDVPPGSTTVEISLEAEGDGTVLLLRHTGCPTARRLPCTKRAGASSRAVSPRPFAETIRGRCPFSRPADPSPSKGFTRIRRGHRLVLRKEDP